MASEVLHGLVVIADLRSLASRSPDTGNNSMACSPQRNLVAAARRKSIDTWSNFSIARLPSPKDNWRLENVIGRGEFGVVYSACSCKADGIQIAAAKVIEVDETDSYSWSSIRNEVCILQQYKHANIVQLYGAYREDMLDDSRGVRQKCKLWVVMEMCDGGSLKHLAKSAVSDRAPLPEKVIRYLLHEILQGLRYLHDNNVIHRDVKGSNILLTKKGNVKLVDFGIAAKILQTDGARRRRSAVGTPQYMAPEVTFCETQDDLDYDSRCDSWSLGITAIQIAEGKPPLSHLTNNEARLHIPRNGPPTLSEKDKWSAEFNEFISSCLVKDLEQRPFCRDLINHSFFSQMDDESLVSYRFSSS
jgi:myosin-3